VLIVDDNDDIRNNLSEFLLTQGFETEIAENGIKALKVFIEHSFDLVITDLQMPYMDGLTLLSEIKKLEPKTSVILMTADLNMVGRTEDVANHIVEKPFRLDEIFNLLKNVFESNDHGCLFTIN
jgi:DNA-binding NtrC family response regulator